MSLPSRLLGANPSIQVSTLLSGSLTTPSAKGAFVGSSYESIATVTVGSGGSSSIDFTSIPSTYTHLQIRGIARVDRATTQTYLRLRFNSDSSTNYSYHGFRGDGSATGVDVGASQDFIETLRFPGSTAGSDMFGAIIIDILDYANTNKYKTVRLLGGADRNGAGEIWSHSGNWRNTTGISSITLLEAITGNFVQYSSFALYGIKGA